MLSEHALVALRHLQQLGLKRLKNQAIARGWSAWHGTWYEITRKRRLMKQAGAYLLKPKLISADGTWRHDWEADASASRMSKQLYGTMGKKRPLSLVTTGEAL